MYAQGAININNSVEEFGLYGADGGRLWIRTGTESLHLWEWLRATREELPGGDMPFADWEDARGVAGQACAASAAAAHLPQVGTEEGRGGGGRAPLLHCNGVCGFVVLGMHRAWRGRRARRGCRRRRCRGEGGFVSCTAMVCVGL